MASCYGNKCPRRRFDGHGTTKERPPNTESAKLLEDRYNKLLQERGTFAPSVPSAEGACAPPRPSASFPSALSSASFPSALSSAPPVYYSLSDAK
jgi:hypothetical protein